MNVGMETLDYHGQPIRQWRAGPSTYRAWPETGARLMDWTIALAGGRARTVVHWPEDADVAHPAKIRGGNPILFPFAARTFDKGELGFWRAADGVRRPMPMHGFARDGRFVLAEADERGFRAVLEPSPAAQAAYPFDYEFSVAYAFAELSFTIELRLENRGSTPLPWCAGHHFYFRLPWHDGLTRGDYALHIPAKKAFRHAADGHLEPEKNFLPETTFADPTIVDLIRCKLKSNVLTFGPKNGEENLRIRHGVEPVPAPWAAVVTWTENDASPFYCVEPWMGPPNAPEHKNGLHLVAPGASETFFVEVSAL
jgi:galactose mutarotase-like enzyme